MEARIKEFFEADFDPGQSQSRTGQSRSEEISSSAASLNGTSFSEIAPILCV
jgi:hypothetical protein